MTDNSQPPFDREISDQQLAAYVHQELQQSTNFAGSEWRESIKQALNYMMLRAKGDEVPGRSEIQDGTVADMLDHVQAEIQPMLASDELIRIEPENPEDEEQSRLEQEALNWYWMERCRGFDSADEAIQDGLLSRNGYLKVWYEESYGIPYDETLEGDSMQVSAQLEQMAQGNDVTIISEELVQDAVTQRVTTIAPDGVTPVEVEVMVSPEVMRAEVRVVPRHQEVKICSVAPEDMAISKEAVDWNLQKPRFVAQKRRMPRYEVKGLGLDPNQVDRMPSVSEYDSDVRTARKREYNTYSRHAATSDGELVDLWEVYYRIDTDGDGIAELVKAFFSAAPEILNYADGSSSREYVRVRPFATAGPMRVAHTQQGRSLFDKTRQVEDGRRKILRQLIDNLASSNDADIVYGPGVRVEDLEETETGRRIYSEVPDNVRYLLNPNTGAESLAALSYLDKMRQERGGSSIQISGPNMPVANTPAHTMERAMSAMEKLIAMYARNFARALLRDTAVLLHQQLKLMPGKVRFQSGEKWVETEPRYWIQRERITVELGLSDGEKMRKQAAGSAIIMQQDKDAEQGSILVDDNGRYEARVDWTAALGVKNPRQYWVDPMSPEGQQAAQARQQAAAQQQAMAAQQQQTIAQMQMSIIAMQEQTKRMANQMDAIEKQRDRLAKLTTEMTKIEAETGKDLPFGLLEGEEDTERLQ